MSLTKQVLDDLSRRDFEEPIYGADSEPWRVYEDVFDAGVWPSEQEVLEDDCEQP